jgi:hypothetical protein
LKNCVRIGVNERNVDLVIGVPRATSYILTRFEIVQHINFARWTHNIFDYLDKLLANELLKGFVGDGSMQVGVRNESFPPDT